MGHDRAYDSEAVTLFRGEGLISTRSVAQAAGWLVGLALLAWGLERLTPLDGWYQITAGLVLIGMGGIRPLYVLIVEGVVPLSETEE